MSVTSTSAVGPPDRVIQKSDVYRMDLEEFEILTDQEIRQLFEIEGLNRLPKKGSKGKSVLLTDPATGTKKQITSGSFNPLHRCKIAQMSEDGQFLVIPESEGSWMMGKRAQSSMFIRDAYKDHWELIKHHFEETPRSQHEDIRPVVIKGTPGVGKTVGGWYFLNQLFTEFGEDVPPIVYVPNKKRQCFIHFRGEFYSHYNFDHFTSTKPYMTMVAHSGGQVWHIYDSCFPSNPEEYQVSGNLIVITSPGRAVEDDMKLMAKIDSLVLYLPLPTFQEMEIMRSSMWNDPTQPKRYMSQTRMRELTKKFGCVPRTVFEFGNSPLALNEIEGKFNTVGDVERMLNMVGGSVINHDVASGSFLHIMPYRGIIFEAEDGEIDTSTKDKGKRTAADADLDQSGLTNVERLALLRDHYTHIIFIWASDYIRDLAFQAFLSLTADRMMQIVLNQTRGSAAFRGILLEPFVHKLFNESGVIGRMRNLETGKELGTIKLGPWKKKNIYENHAQINLHEGYYNVPLKSNEPAIDSLVPYDGYCFQITTSPRKHGINHPKFELLMKSGVFDPFGARMKRKKNVQFVWIVEAQSYATFQKQNYEGKGGRAYAAGSPLKSKYPAVDQMVFEIDMRRVYEFHSGLIPKKAVDMTDKVAKLEKAIRKAGLGSSNQTTSAQQESTAQPGNTTQA